MMIAPPGGGRSIDQFVEDERTHAADGHQPQIGEPCAGPAVETSTRMAPLASAEFAGAGGEFGAGMPILDWGAEG